MLKTNPEKIPLVFETEVPYDETVLRIQFTGRTIAVQLFLGGARCYSACAEEGIRLKFFKGILLIGRAYSAVLPAYLPVLFRVLHSTYIGFHRGGMVSRE
jgi:hypothetical protein